MPIHSRSLALTVAVFASLGTARAQDPTPTAPAAPATPSEQFAAIKQEHKQALAAFEELYKAAKTEDERQKLFERYPRGETFAPRVIAVVKKAPGDPVAIEATNWLLGISNGGAELDELLDVLLTHHLASKGLADTCKALVYTTTPHSERFLREVLAKSEHPEARGRACYSLAKQLASQAHLIERLHGQVDPQLVEWLTESRGAPAVDAMKRTDPAPLQAEAEALLERVVADYGELAAYQKTLGQQAKGDLFEMRNLVVGKVAPDIEGTDVDGVAFKLSDYRGKVIFLDFWGFW